MRLSCFFVLCALTIIVAPLAHSQGILSETSGMQGDRSLAVKDRTDTVQGFCGSQKVGIAWGKNQTVRLNRGSRSEEVPSNYSDIARLLSEGGILRVFLSCQTDGDVQVVIFRGLKDGEQIVYSEVFFTFDRSAQINYRLPVENIALEDVARRFAG